MARIRRFSMVVAFVAASWWLTALGSGLSAQTSVPGNSRTQPRSQLAPGQIDTAISRIYVHVDKTGFGHEHGIESRVKSGGMQLGANRNAGEIVFDMTSFRADTDNAVPLCRIGRLE